MLRRDEADVFEVAALARRVLLLFVLPPILARLGSLRIPVKAVVILPGLSVVIFMTGQMVPKI